MAVFALALIVFALQSIVVPVQPGRDMPRYIQSYVQLAHDYVVLPVVVNTRGPLAALGVSVPLQIGGAAAGILLAVLYAGSIVAWGVVALKFGPRAAIVTTGLLLVFPGYGILFHGLASDALFAAAFAGWAIVLARAILRPSSWSFAAAGLGMGLLALVRPANQVLIALALLPLLVRAPWGRRLQWVAAFFVASVVVTQGWKALATWRLGDVVALRPSAAVLATALLLCVLFLPSVWRRRAALVAVPLVVVAIAVVAIRGDLRNPAEYARKLAQTPPTSIFLFRVFEMDRIVEPENGTASRQLALAVDRELLTKEPYLSYGIDLDEFFSSGSDRMFVDLNTIAGQDLQAVTEEAIRAHPWAFAKGIADTIWAQLWARRVYARESVASTEPGRPVEPPVIVVDGMTLPRPSEGEPIPTSVAGPGFIGDERLQARLERDTLDLEVRLPNREGTEHAHRLNQASRAFPPIVVWLAVGLVALAVRRPRGSLVALALSAAALLVIVATAMVTLAVAEYAVPVAPAFILLTGVGLVGLHPRGRLRLPRRA